MALLLMAVVPEKREEFEGHFREVATAGDEEHPDAALSSGKTYSWHATKACSHIGL